MAGSYRVIVLSTAFKSVCALQTTVNVLVIKKIILAFVCVSMFSASRTHAHASRKRRQTVTSARARVYADNDTLRYTHGGERARKHTYTNIPYMYTVHVVYEQTARQ